MALAVRRIVAALAQSRDPVVVVELRLPDIAAAQPDALAIDARKIGLAADARSIADVQRVIPDIQFPGIRRVDGRDDIRQVRASR